MLTLFKHLKNSKWTIVLIALLLFVQAYADLSLPEYTANIVNIGITQGGVAEVAPDEMRPETLEALSLYMNEGEYERVLSVYQADARGILILQAKDRETLDMLADILSVPMAIVSQFGQGGDVRPERLNQLSESGLLAQEQIEKFEGIARLGQSGGAADPLETMQAITSSGLLTQEQLARLTEMAPEAIQGMLIRAFADTLFGENTELMLGQMAIAFVRAEYQAIGVDMKAVQTKYLLTTGAKMLGMTLLMIAAAIGAGYLAARTGAKTARDLRERLFSTVVSFSQSDIEKFSTASLITRSTNDIQQVVMATIMMLRIALYAPILGVGGVLRVMQTSTGMGWIIYVAVALLLVVVGALLLLALPRFNRMQSLIDRINLVAREILTGLPVIRAFNREKYENERFEDANKVLMQTQLFTTRTMTLMMPMLMLIMNGISLLIIWVGGKGMDLGQLQVGDMMAFISYTMQIVTSFLMLSMMSIFLPRAIVSADRIDKVLSTKPSIADKERTADDAHAEWKGVVSFEQVSFRYSDADEEVLSGINFTAEPGKTTAIIGSTGSGKSTLLNLIPRFFDVTSGRVTIDGVDIRDLSQHKLHSLLGYVPQKGILFSGDIESNIKFGGDFITDEDMVMAVEIAQADGFIGEKAEGFKDPIAQGGTNVSGGQKQRLSIARALAKKPPVLLFDDSFSALDYKTDVALRRALSERLTDVTVIIVAQRISTVLHADQILVMHEGRIAGKGRHQELMQNCPLYAEIAKSQLSEAELTGGALA